MRGAEAQVDAQPGEWARYVFGLEAAEFAAPRPLPVACQGEHG